MNRESQPERRAWLGAATLPLFRGLPPDQVERIAQVAVERKVPKGEIIFEEGESAEGFYVVLTGRVKVYKLSWEGKEQTLHILGPGEPFGEVAVFAGERFPAHAQALEPSRLLFFPREGLLSLIRRHPALAMNMIGTLARRLRRFTALVEDLSLKEVPARLAAYLLYLKGRSHGPEEVFLDISKGQLASLLGTIPETLSRVLAKMSQAGFIEVHGAHIVLRDLERLEALAEGVERL